MERAMDFKKKLFSIIFFIVSVFMFNLPGTALAGAPGIMKPAPGTYLYGGMIKDITSSSITLYNGVTVYITGDTKCMAPQPSAAMESMSDISCSDLKKGETVRVEAAKNSSGELVATLIQEYFS